MTDAVRSFNINCLPILNLHRHNHDNLKSRMFAVNTLYPTKLLKPLHTFLPERLA